MTVQVRAKRVEKRIRRNRAPSSAKRQGAAVEMPRQERRDVDPHQDTALYNCQCGFVFEAPVCTTVACPHCGTSQAW